jgi:hypothetical protein
MTSKVLSHRITIERWIVKTNHNKNKAQKSNTMKKQFENIQTFFETKNLVNIWLDKT